MKLSRFWTPVQPRPEPDEPVETVAAGEPETGVFSLQQLMESLGPSNTPFDPDSTTYFSANELLLRRDQLSAAVPKPDATAKPATSPGTPCAAQPEHTQSSARRSHGESRRLAPVTKVSVLLLFPALAMLCLPRSSAEGARAAPVSSNSANTSPVTASSAEDSATVPAIPERTPEPDHVVVKGITRERSAVDHLAAGDFAHALEDYTGLAGRSPAHAAAVRILQRRLKTEREAGR